MTGNSLPCELAMMRWKNLAMWRNLWTILLFIFGTTVIGFLCAAIVLFIKQDWLPGALTTFITIVNGAGVTWVYNRRQEAVAEEKEAYEDVQKKCGGGGGGTADTVAPPIDPEAPFKHLKLFGLVR